MRRRSISSSLLEAAGIPDAPHPDIALFARRNGLSVRAVEATVDGIIADADRKGARVTTEGVIEALQVVAAFQCAGRELAEDALRSVGDAPTKIRK